MTPPQDFYWMGTDEAGYGARLGPLVISSTSWRLPSDRHLADAEVLSIASPVQQLQVVDQICWQTALAPIIQQVPVSDSKKLYQPGKGLQRLQQAVSSWLLAAGQTQKSPNDLGQLLKIVSADGTRKAEGGSRSFQPYWFTGLPASWPADPDWQQEIQAWKQGSIEPVYAESRVMDEAAFNHGLERFGNKANLLSTETLELVRSALNHLPSTDLLIVDLDRHGGRKRYLPILLQVFQADWMQILEETPEVSTYCWQNGSQRIFFRFSVNGEQRIPVALSSMFSKLIRERAMDCFNACWESWLPSVKPTAGYPVDAARFQKDTESIRQTREISEREFWRNA